MIKYEQFITRVDGTTPHRDKIQDIKAQIECIYGSCHTNDILETNSIKCSSCNTFPKIVSGRSCCFFCECLKCKKVSIPSDSQVGAINEWNKMNKQKSSTA